MEHILGQPSRFIYCSRYTILSDELSKLTQDTTKTLIISCLTPIVASLAASAEAKKAIEKGMSTLGAMMRELSRTNAGMRVFIAPCTPRGTPDYETHSTFALVTNLISLRVYLSFLNLYTVFQRCLSDAVQENEMISVLNWVSQYEVKPDKVSLTEASAKQYLEELLAAVRRGLDRKRTFSTSSSSSGSMKSPQASSTPTRQKRSNLTQDIRRDMA